ncbi:MAG: aminotransferase class I/II-fold pyridoxal phosphate-dependent enzyme [Lachnospiraceae bacterium]|nr:aminotransferase class I/II-fold pyridoxal phosphate-dependent enzyme [Lachnospiraceae bacterium]
MKYDFTTMMDRHGRDSIAVDGIGRRPGFAPEKPMDGFDAIPMWIADMNFPTVPTVCEAIIERAKHPAFGYFEADMSSYYSDIIHWQVMRNGCDPKLLTADCIGYENGVLGGVVSALTAFAAPGDAVLLHSPTYIGFTNCIKNNGYEIVHSPLVKDENGVWRMDFKDMDQKIKAYKIHVAVFCSPHNPCGRVWEKWEIEQAMEVYRANDCLVISDEIWSDILLNGNKHVPTQSVSEDARNRTAAFYAPSKTFNLAGLVGAYHIIYNKYLRDRIVAKSGKPHYNEMNVLSMHALIGAYRPEGYQWVDELCETLSGNINYAYAYIQEHFDGVEVSKPQGTYMMFIDCTKWCENHGKTIEELERACWEVGVAIQDGRMFHGPCSIRMNLALPLHKVKEAFERLDRWVFNRTEGEIPNAEQSM